MLRKITPLQWVAIVLLVLAITWIFIGPWLLNREGLQGHFDFHDSGQIGDTIGGITAPAIGLLSAVLVYLSFTAQIQANRNVQEEANFKYLLDEFDKVKKTFDKYYYFSKYHDTVFEAPEYKGIEGLYELSKQVMEHPDRITTANWAFDSDIIKAGYLLQNYSLFINEVSTVKLSLSQKRLIEAKIWLNYAENLNDIFQNIAAWKVEMPSKNIFDNAISKNMNDTFQFKLLTLDITRTIEPFKNSLPTS